MTPVDQAFAYESPPRECDLEAIYHIRDVYGIRRVSVDERAGAIRVEYDSSRLTESDVAALLRCGRYQAI